MSYRSRSDGTHLRQMIECWIWGCPSGFQGEAVVFRDLTTTPSSSAKSPRYPPSSDAVPSSTHLGGQLGDDPVRILFPHRPLPETLLSLGEAKGLHRMHERRGHIVPCRLLRSLRIVRARAQVRGETGDEDGPEVVQRARCLLFRSKGKWMSIALKVIGVNARLYLEVRQGPLDPLRLIPVLHRSQSRINSSEVVDHRRAFERKRGEGDGGVRLK
jgi:hypothetical protein